MSLRLYEDASLTEIVTLESVFTNPDAESDIDGDTGEEKQATLYAAMEQTTLNGGINDTVTTIVTTAARFASAALPILYCGTEKMLITAGFGTTSLTVVRGYHGTTTAAHLTGAAVILAYDASAITIESEDNSGTDESAWLDYRLSSEADEAGSYDNPKTLTDIAHDSSLSIVRRLTVPASSSPEDKQDLLHVLGCTLHEAA